MTTTIEPEVSEREVAQKPSTWPLIFEHSKPGRRGYQLPALDVPESAALPASLMRGEITDADLDRPTDPEEGRNPDGLPQLFLWREAENEFVQLTRITVEGFTVRRPSIAASGQRIAFECDADLDPVLNRQLALLQRPSLSVEDKLRALRVFQLAAIDSKNVTPSLKKRTHSALIAQFPSQDERLNRQLANTLAWAGQPAAIARVSQIPIAIASSHACGELGSRGDPVLHDCPARRLATVSRRGGNRYFSSAAGACQQRALRRRPSLAPFRPRLAQSRPPPWLVVTRSRPAPTPGETDITGGVT